MTKIKNYSLSLICLLLSIYYTIDFPYGIPLIITVSLACVFWLIRDRYAWMFFIPALIPIYDLGLFSGRMHFTEFDILLLSVLCVLYFQNAVRPLPATKQTRPEWVIVLLFISYVISFLVDQPFKYDFTINSFADYLSPYNSLRIAKSFLFVWLFWQIFRQQYAQEPEKSDNLLIAGILTGLCLMGLAVLWERGVFNALFHQFDLRAAINSFTNMSSSYRITGLFSSMHVGGTAVDGYLVMTIPFSLIVLFKSANTKIQTLSFCALSLGIYSVIVTFSRGLYMGFVGALVIFMLTYILFSPKKDKLDIKAILFGGISLIVLLAYSGYIFKIGGNQVLLGLFIAIFTPLLSFRFLDSLSSLVKFIILGIIVLLSSWLMFDGLIESKWNENSLIFSAAVSLLTPLMIASAFQITIAGKLGKIRKNVFLMGIVFISIFLYFGANSFNSYHASSRFATSSEDLDHRISQWTKAINFMKPGLMPNMFGMGLGSYPRYYFLNNLDQEYQVNYQFIEENKDIRLLLGNGDFNIVQKLDFDPDTKYLLSARVRAKSASRLSLSICHKHILYSDRYQPSCLSKSFTINELNEWQDFSEILVSDKLGKAGVLYWPPSLLLNNSSRNTVLEITDLKLIDPHGNNLIKNGNFSDGSDNWLLIRDFSHDDWHVKNIFVHYYFEQGLLGLLAFLGVIITLFWKLSRDRNWHNTYAAAIFAATTGVLLVGLFGTIVDNPKITFLFYLIVFWGLIGKTAPTTTQTEEAA